MPYIYDPNQDKAQQGQDPAATNQNVISSTGSSSSTSGASAGQQPGAPTSSGQFVNPQKYVDANQGQQFGQQVAGKVADDASAAKTAQSTASDSFKNQVDTAAVRPNQDLITQASTNPDQFRQNQSNVDAFTKQRTANYTGPKSFADDSADYTNAYNATQKASEASNASMTEPGRFALLDNYYARPDYNRGQKSLDNLLIQNDPNSQQAFSQAQAAGAAAKTGFDNLNNTSNAYATQAATDTANAKLRALQAFGLTDTGNMTATGALPDFLKSLDQKTADANNASTAQMQQFKDSLANGVLSSQDIQKFGLQGLFGNPGAEDVSSLYKVDPAAYASMPTNQATRYNTATADDYAKAAALAQLGGIANTMLPSDQQSQAGTYKPGINFDTQGFSAAYNSQQNALNSQRQQIMDQLHQVQAQQAAWRPAGDKLEVPPDWDSMYSKLDSQLRQLYDNYGINYDHNSQSIIR